MNKWIIAGIVIAAVLSAGAFYLGTKSNASAVKNIDNTDLSKYKSTSLPEECRLPEGQDIHLWKQHLSHHQQTQHCLDYYKDVN